MRVLMTGVAGRTGRLLAESLLADPAVSSVVGLDRRACYPPVPGLEFVRVDLCQPEWRPLLDQADVAIHLVGTLWPLRRAYHALDAVLVDETKQFLHAARAAQVPKVILGSSTAVYGPQPGPVREDAPVHGHQGGAYARARALLADYLDAVERDWLTGVLTRLRLTCVSGARHLGLIQSFASGPVLACGYEDRRLQVLHEDDMSAAFMLAVRQDLPGIYHVSGDPGMTFRELAALVGQNRTCMPLAWITLRAWVGWRWLARRTPPAWVRFLYQAAPVDSTRLRAAGWTPRYSARAAVNEALDALQTGV